MAWKTMANIVALVHGLWAVTVVFGALVSWQFPVFRWIHLAMMLITLVLIFAGKLCPLTTLEQKLRAKHDPNTTYSGGFISEYLSRTLRFNVPDVSVLYFLLIWSVLWGAVYWRW